MSHKYHVRQLVRLLHARMGEARGSSGAVFEVTRLMPADQTGEVSYRIKASGGLEQAVREGEIGPR